VAHIARDLATKNCMLCLTSVKASLHAVGTRWHFMATTKGIILDWNQRALAGGRH